MTYTFSCPKCAGVIELEQPMDSDHAPPQCECGSPTNREYNNNSICDEIRGVDYWSPTAGKEVRGHGRYYDLGMGAWVESKSHRRTLMKEKGLVEHGPEQKNPPG